MTGVSGPLEGATPPTPLLLRWLGFKRLHVGTADIQMIEDYNSDPNLAVVFNFDQRYEVKWRWSWRWIFGRYW